MAVLFEGAVCSICKRNLTSNKLSYEIEGQPVYVCSERCNRRRLVNKYGSVCEIECEYACDQEQTFEERILDLNRIGTSS